MENTDGELFGIHPSPKVYGTNSDYPVGVPRKEHNIAANRGSKMDGQTYPLGSSNNNSG